MRQTVAIAAPIIFLALLLGAWEAACRLLNVPVYLLPAPSQVAVALAQNASTLFLSAWATFSTAVEAFLIVSLLANLSALAAATSRIVEDSFRPIAVTLQVTPIFAIAPLIVVWVGIDHPEHAILAIAVIAAFFPIYSGTLAGLNAPDPELVRLFDLYGATLWQKLTRLRVPSAIPQALEGGKIGLGLSLVGAVIGEMVAGSGTTEGLSWRIMEAAHRLEMAKSFAALVAVAVLGGALYVGFQTLERFALDWWRGRPPPRR